MLHFEPSFWRSNRERDGGWKELMSGLLRFGTRTLVVIWSLVCVLAYVLVEVLGEAFVGQVGALFGSPIGWLVGFLHDIGMVLLVLVWLVVAWLIWKAGNLLRR
jgi:hypothetical protein